MTAQLPTCSYLHHCGPTLPWQRVDLEVRLDPGQNAELLEALGEQRVARAAAALVQRLWVQDGCAEEGISSRSLKQHLAVGTTRLLAVGYSILGKSVTCGRGRCFGA